jgi:CheY-like chemotaxis protein
VVSRHPATLKHVAQALAVASLTGRQAIGPAFLPRSGPGEFDLALLDLDVDAAQLPHELCAQVAAALPDTPIVVVAGNQARHRLLQALAFENVVGVVPKPTLAGGETVAAEGPDEQWLGLALRRRVDRALQPLGPGPYLLGGTHVEERLVGGTFAKEAVLHELLADAGRFSFSDEKLRRIETAADELMLNAIYNAPHDDDGRPIYRDMDRRNVVTLAAQAQVRLRWGCDGRTFALSVADRFGTLTRAAVANHLGKLLDARSPRLARTDARGGAGLGLALTFSAGNELAVQLAPGRFTEVTCALQVAGSNRVALARGSALHLYWI